MNKNVANYVTLSRLIPLPFIIYFLSSNSQIALLFFFISMGADLIDGRIARRFKAESRMGIYLDPMVDKIVINSIFIYLSYINIIPVWMTVLNIIREFIVQAVRSIAPVKNVVLKTGTLNKSKLAVQTITITIAFLELMKITLVTGLTYYSMLLTLVIGYASMFTLILYNKEIFTKEEMEIKVRTDYEAKKHQIQ